MLNGNKLVVILPVFLMIFLFVGGAVYVQQSEEVTNEALHEEVEWDTLMTHNGEDEGLTTLRAAWEWTAMPSEGLAGEDYIGVTFLDEDGQPMQAELADESHIYLTYGNEVVYEDEAVSVENGFVFSFPNETDEHQSFGDRGSIEVTVETEDNPQRAIVSYLHTWEAHDGLEKTDARFFEPVLSGMRGSDSSYWVIERYVDNEESTIE
ncbi:hypothetical protein [Bacillus sp. FJAT-44742]|uniref:hypothetical protein n=1 Tax=Bacillus sp. FJAT-44742 TaxID=2014005 RepID=UPI000C24DB21|nr:hypothetical protein [Bacillus sp. FJAT-44742]